MKRSSHSSQKVSARDSSYPRQFGHQRPGRTSITQSIFPTRRAAAHFTDLPPPKSNAPYHLDLADVISQDEIKSINENGNISFMLLVIQVGSITQHINKSTQRLWKQIFLTQTNNNPLSFII